MRQQIISGFIISVDKGEVCRISKPESIHNGKNMVVLPFAIYNMRSTPRKLSNDSYYYVSKGRIARFSIKADYAFRDSPLNSLVKPKSVVYGYIRIPYNGAGKYGIVVNSGQRGKKQFFVWDFQDVSLKNMTINREGMEPRHIELLIKNNNTSNSPNKEKTTRLHSPSNSKKVIEDGLYRPDTLDMYDYNTRQAIIRHESEFGYGRKKSNEWNDDAALAFNKRMAKYRKCRKKSRRK